MIDLIVIRGGFKDPDTVRKIALDIPPNQLQNGALDGSLIIPFPMRTADIVEGVSHVVNEPVNYSELTGYFIAQNNQLELNLGYLILGSPKAVWMAYVNLSGRKEEINILRYNPIGLTYLPIWSVEEMESVGFNSYEDIDNLNYSDEELWSIDSTISLNHNDMIIMRPWIFHSWGDLDGDDLETGRLFLLYHFELKNND